MRAAGATKWRGALESDGVDQLDQCSPARCDSLQGTLLRGVAVIGRRNYRHHNYIHLIFSIGNILIQMQCIEVYYGTVA